MVQKQPANMATRQYSRFQWGLATALVALGIAGAVTAAALDEKATIRTIASLDSSPDLTHVAAPHSDTCQKCHSFDPLFSHPVNIAPPARMTVPPSLPLVGGNVTCVTCHSGLNRNHFLDRQDDDPGVQTNTGPALCSQCHDSTGITAVDMHASATAQAHPAQPGTAWSAANSTASHWMDSPSTSCLTCHDGSMAGDISMASNPSSGIFGRPMSNEHPVSVEYRVTDPQAADGTLKPVEALDDRIRLFNNQVECRSCHSLYSTEPNLLVMSNDRSRLCLSCHEY